ILENGLSTWENRNPGTNLPYTLAIAVSGSKIYAASIGTHLGESVDGGTTWGYIEPNGNLNYLAMCLSGSKIYLSIQNFGIVVGTPTATAVSWGATSTVANSGLASNTVLTLVSDGTKVYAGTDAGLSISADQGTSWKTYTTDDGLAGNEIWGLA